MDFSDDDEDMDNFRTRPSHTQTSSHLNAALPMHPGLRYVPDLVYTTHTDLFYAPSITLHHPANFLPT